MEFSYLLQLLPSFLSPASIAVGHMPKEVFDAIQRVREHDRRLGKGEHRVGHDPQNTHWDPAQGRPCELPRPAQPSQREAQEESLQPLEQLLEGVKVVVNILPKLVSCQKKGAGMAARVSLSNDKK